MSIQTLVNLAVAGIVCVILYYVASLVISGTILLLIGILLVLIFIVYVLNTLGLIK